MSAFGGPNIIDDGLVLYLDAGNRKSYPGSGTTWFDKSGRGNNGTLINGPTFNTGSLGSIVFDGVDDYFTTAMSSSLNEYTTGAAPIFTVCNWIYLTANAGIVDGLGIASPVQAQSWAHYYYYTNPSGPTYNFNKINAGYSNSRTFQIITSPNSVLPNRWNNIVTIYNAGTVSFYVNGESVSGTITANDSSTAIVDNDFGLVIGKSNLGLGGESLNGKISNYAIYSKALSAQEVLQNFNAQKGRFNL